MSIERRYDEAATFREYVDAAVKNKELWTWGARRAQVGDDLVARAAAVGGHWHLLVLSEDWCGDAANSVPVIARLAELAPNLDLRIVGRDANPDLMDAHLTGTSRAIPVVILYDEAWRERAWWGSRPAPLQHWVMTEGLALPKEERYPRVREWYARDKGRTTASEIVGLLELVAREAAGADEARGAAA